MALRTHITWPGFTALMALLISRCYFIVKDANSNYIHRKLSRNADYHHIRQSEKRNCRSESINSTSAIPNLDTYTNFYYNFSLIFNIYYTIKHLLIVLLDFEAFSDFRYLDCYLLGRLCLNARVVGMANLFACFISLFHVLWALFLRLQSNKFQMPSVEFLLHKEAEISYWNDRDEHTYGAQIHLNRRNQSEQLQSGCGDLNGESRAYHSSLFHYFNSPQRFDSQKRSDVLIRVNNQCLMTRNKLSESIGEAEICKHRPNRTLKSWRKLCETCNSITAFLIAIATAANLAVWWWALPLILFNRGFELTHGNCVRYIAEQKTSNNGTVNLWIDHRLIFDPPDSGSYQTPERPLYFMSLLNDNELVHINWYHTTRALVCSIELFIFYTELYTSFSSKAIITTIITTDICNYCADINRRLGQLIQDQNSLLILKASQSSEETNGSMKKARERQIERNIRRHTIELQAMIGDMFQLIHNYNHYASIQAIYLIVLWLCYSALVSGWMFLPLDNLPKAEWYAMHAFATAFLFIMIVPFARVRRDSMQIHRKMSIAMALDQDYRGSKRTWLSLSRFYMPVPMYCFTIQREVEMSMLFALKLLAWLFTALSVVSNFFIFRYPSKTM